MYAFRQASAADYEDIASAVDHWWGRPVRAMLPRLFLDHFYETSLVLRDEAGALTGFLVGFLSPSRSSEAYIHFVGVSPHLRGKGVARAMYEEFFGLAEAGGRSVVRAVTSHVNAESIAFHRSLGFTVDDQTDPDLVLFARY